MDFLLFMLFCASSCDILDAVTFCSPGTVRMFRIACGDFGGSDVDIIVPIFAHSILFLAPPLVRD